MVMRQKFRIGDKVRWVSQAGGHEKIKCGYIFRIIPARCNPELTIEDMREFNTKALDSGYYRDHESYIVRVPTKTGRGRDRLYRPVVSRLEGYDW